MSLLHTLKDFLQTRPVPAAVLAAAAVLAVAYGFQLAGYPPCEMCYWQRYPYMGVILIGLVSLLLKQDGKVWPVFAAAALFEVTGWIAGFHVGVELGWWEGPTTCTGLPDLSGDPGAALETIMTAPLIRCDEVAWSLFGISMAGYNFIVAMILAGVFAVLGFRRMKTA
ncbi:disulfide bond formation protein B [Eilatimonas milleporae]|uniref:Disulfide bond formation protein DsbB n=1 Tax=Eilatimonas milleporae TaxID=911205 RepID=A0A3M0C7A5_9PROT|nr:disulfide bond formation protein B [Eilatimonas milleporae]RMB02686.1 disulfide bond formation protein DsbB [Eilatimonas milleporae]